MIYCLLGQTCSGKTTLLKELESKKNIKNVISYTTRPKRKNEVDKKDYNFVSDDQYHRTTLIAKNEFISSNGDVWKYGINPLDLDKESNLFLIVEPKGYKDLINYFGKNNVTGIYLNVGTSERIIRGLSRGDDIDELKRRIRSDEDDFYKIEEISDHIISKVDINEILSEIQNII